MKTIPEFQEAFAKDKKITMVTCYDHWTAKILSNTEVDALLVGDSVAMVMHGHTSPVSATLEMMCLHTESVRRGAPDKVIVADLPFMTFRKDLVTGLTAAEALIRAGANAVKLEGLKGHEELVERLVDSGIPVMGHLGLTPQSVNAFGGFKVQGRDKQQSESILREARNLESLGCFAVVLECVPSALTTKIQQILSVPAIGIGAGPDAGGQVLVLQDLLGADHSFQPKFLRQFANLESEISGAINAYCQDVQSGAFPSIGESYE